MKTLYKVLFAVIAGLFTAGIVSASLGEYWSTVSHIIPRTNDAVDIGSTVKRVRSFFTNDLIFYDEIKPDNATCSNGQILKRTGADNWDCVVDSAGTDEIDDTMIDWGTGTNQVSSCDVPDHNGHSVRDTFVHIVNRGVAEAITVTLTGGLGVSWTTGEIYDRANHTFVATDAGSGNVTNNVVNYLKWVSGTTLTLSTTDTTGDEVLIAIGTIYDGNIDGYRETSLLDESLANIRRCSRAVFPTRVTSGMSVHEDADATNPLDVTMDAGVYCKELQERITPVEIKSRNTAMVRHFHTGGVWDSDTNAQIETTNYDNGTGKTAIPANKYVKGMFIYMSAKIGFVYPTEYFNTIAQAQDAALPAMPTGLEPIPKLTAIVYQQGAANFTGAIWQDVRAGISEESFSGVTDHGALAGLSDDDHTIYTLADGTRAFTGNQSFGGFNITSAVWNGTALTDAYVSNTLTVDGYMQDGDINTFTELQSWVSDETLLKAGTLTDAKYCIYDSASTDIICNSTPAGTGDLLADGTIPMTADFNLDGNNLDNGGVIFLKEQADADADIAGQGQIWVNTATPNELWFTDDAGTDAQLGVAGLTNLTDFDQTAWRLFYSNNLGDVVELSLGTDGQYLKSQGGTSTLTWGVPTNTTYLGGTNLTLAGTTFNVDDAFVINSGSDIIGGGSGFTHTFNASAGSDSVFTFGDGTVNLSTGALQVGGNAVLTGNETITLSGDVTGSGETALTVTVSSDKILETHLKSVNAPTDEYCLTYEATTGDFEWQVCSAGAGDVTSVFDCASGDCNIMTVGTSEYLTYGTGYIDANRFLGVTTVDGTEFGYLNGVTSSIQTQLTGKQSTLTNSAGLLAALSDETGTGLSVFSTSPTFTTGITVPNDSISAAELNEGDAFTWTSTHDFGGATSLEIPNGVAPTVNAIGEVALDTTSDQLVYYGSAKRVLQEEDTKCFSLENLAAADDNYEFYMANDAVTITAIGLHCAGTCTTGADISLEDRAGNAMTHTTPTHSTGSGNTTFQAVTNNNTLVSGEGLRFDVDNAVSPETDTYLICFKMKYTSD